MKKTLEMLLAASMIASQPASAGLLDDIKSSIGNAAEEFNARAEEKTRLAMTDLELLEEAVRERYNAKAEQQNSDPGRKRDYEWQFYSLQNMPPRDEKSKSFFDRRYKKIEQSGDVFFIDKSLALVGIKSYYRTFTGDVSRYYYKAERYRMKTVERPSVSGGTKWFKEWNYVGDYHTCTTDSHDKPINPTSKSFWSKMFGG